MSGKHNEREWPWSDELDAKIAAPDSHEILLENEQVRVARVVIPPGHREPPHTHRWVSVMITDGPARIRYYGEDGELAFESEPDMDYTPKKPRWMDAEGLHSVENIDTKPYQAYRIELKNGKG
ncbi:MAG: hypothetical protein AAF639_03000 [Chloroflexota bacterium]